MDRLGKIFSDEAVTAFKRSEIGASLRDHYNKTEVDAAWTRWLGSREGVKFAPSDGRWVNPMAVVLKYAKDTDTTGAATTKSIGASVYDTVRIDPHEDKHAEFLTWFVSRALKKNVDLRMDTKNQELLTGLDAKAIGEHVRHEIPILVMDAGTRNLVKVKSAPELKDAWHLAGDKRDESLNRWWASAAERKDNGELIGANYDFLMGHANDRRFGKTGATPENVESWADEQKAAGVKLAGDAKIAAVLFSAVRRGKALPVAATKDEDAPATPASPSPAGKDVNPSTPASTKGVHASTNKDTSYIAAPVVRGEENKCIGSKLVPIVGLGTGGGSAAQIGAQFVSFDDTAAKACSGARFIPFATKGARCMHDDLVPIDDGRPMQVGAKVTDTNSDAKRMLGLSDASVHMSHLGPAIAKAKEKANGRQVWVLPVSNERMGKGGVPVNFWNRDHYEHKAVNEASVGVRVNDPTSMHVDLEMLRTGKLVRMGIAPCGTGFSPTEHLHRWDQFAHPDGVTVAFEKK